MGRHRFATRVAVVLLSIAPLVGAAPGNAAVAPDLESPAVSDTPVGARARGADGEPAPRITIDGDTVRAAPRSSL